MNTTFHPVRDLQVIKVRILFSGDFVVKRDDARDLNEYGCVVRADNQERILQVYWSPSGQTSEVCAFDIDEHQDYKHIRIGELVVYSNTENVDLTHRGVSGVGMVLRYRTVFWTFLN